MLPYNGKIPATETTLYTVPKKRKAEIGFFTCINNGSVASTLALYVTVRGVKTRITPSLNLKPGGGWELESRQIHLPENGTISGVAGVADIIEYFISGNEDIGSGNTNKQVN